MAIWNRLHRSDHEKVRQLLSPYLDGETSEREKAFVEKHLSSCQTCQDELKSLRWTTGLLGQTTAEPLPRSFVLRRADVERARKTPRLRWAYPMLRGATAVAALLLVVTLAVDWGTGRNALPASAPVQKRSIQSLQESAPQAAPLTTRAANAGTRETPPAEGAQAAPPPPLKTAPTATAVPNQAVTSTPEPSGGSGGRVPPLPPTPTAGRHNWRLIEAALGALFLLLLGTTWWAASRS